ncbi:MAG TPA: MFS transporter [Magnetospirillaceae bacterium]|jgi:MFS family permease
MRQDGSVSAGPSGGFSWWVVFLLALMYILSFIDRSILGLLIQPIKAELGVDDIEVGFLIGPAFGVFYAILGLPVARLADIGNRVMIVILGVLIWGFATTGSAFAQSFWLLMLLRVGLSVGEAVLTPCAYSLISDMFRPERRAFPTSLYSATGMAGASVSYILGALILRYVGGLKAAGVDLPMPTWRLVLLIVGIPSIVVAVIFAISVREPKRRATAAAIPPVGEVVRYLFDRFRFFGLLFIGAGLMDAIVYANQSWGAEVMRRHFGLAPQQAGLMLGIAGLIGGFSGTITVPAIARLLTRLGRRDAVVLTTMGALIWGAFFSWLAPQQSDGMGFAIVGALSTFGIVGGANNVLVSLQHLTPDRMRGVFIGLLLMCLSLLGLGIGPTLAAYISTSLDPSGQQLGHALSLLAPIIAVPALILMAISRGGSPEAKASTRAAAAETRA